MRKLVIIIISVICWSSIFASCGTEDDYMFDGKIDSTFVADTIIRHDTIIIHNDSTNKNDTIIKTDTIINKDTIISNHDKKILLDFDILTEANIKVEKAFKMNNSSNTSYQGMAVFNDYLFQCRHSNNIIDVYNLKNNNLAFTIEQKGEGTLHCNNVDFGTQYYSETDEFPLLYLEHKGTQHKTSVYRIIKNENAYTAEKIQTFNFSPCSWSISNNDTDNGYMYISHDGIGLSYNIAKIKIPDFKDGDLEITLNAESCVEYFPVEDNSNKVGQDATIYKNKLFQLKGQSGNSELRIYNLNNHNLIFSVDLRKMGISGEPEGIAWYKDHIMISVINGQIYNMYFIE